MKSVSVVFRNQVSIYLKYVSGGITKETFIGYYPMTVKIGSATVHYNLFSLAGPRDKQFAFAIRAKLGLTPQMDVGPYAYARTAWNEKGDAAEDSAV